MPERKRFFSIDPFPYCDDDDVAAYSSLGLVVGSPSENSASKSPQILESGWNEAKRSQASTKYGMRSKTEIRNEAKESQL